MIKLPKLIFNLTWINKISENITNSNWAIFIFLFVTGFAYWLTQINFLDLQLSSNGYSPLAVIYSTFDPIVSKIDFPQGVHNLKKSLPMNVYFWFHAYTNFNLIYVFKAYMLFEIYLLLFAHYYFFTTIIKKNIPILAFVFTLVVSLSAFQFMNVARFGFPFIWGLYYSISAALSVIGLSLVIKNKPWSAAIIFFFNIATHPIMAMFSILCATIIIISRGFETIKKYLLPAIIFSFLIFLWFVLNFSNSEISSGKIPKDDWIALTKMLNSHWYPFYIGVFSSISDYHFLPTVSLMLLYMIAQNKIKNEKSTLFKEINLIVICLSVLTLFGLIISYFEISPFLIKLSLPRASSLLVVVALVPVIYLLWTELIFGNFVQKSLAIIILLSPLNFSGHPGFYLFFSLIYGAIFLYNLFKEKKFKSLTLSIFLYLIAIGIFLFVIFKGYHKNIIPYNKIFWLFTLFLILLTFLNFSRLILILIAIYICIAIPTFNLKKNYADYNRSEYLSMYEMQQWYKNNTSKYDLIMLNPDYHGGGWRDISERASFGTTREWLHNAWLYDSNFKLYQEGVRRFSLLGLNPENYFSLNHSDAQIKIKSDTIEAYYNKENAWFKKMSEKENIKYFAFEKNFMKENRYNLYCPYENRHYVICKLKKSFK